MELWPAFLLGLAGSVHCAGMCGPLVLALPAGGSTRSSLVLGRAAYNLGRLTTYAALGVGFGLLGQSLMVVGLQRWVSLGAGGLLLIALLASSRYSLGAPITQVVGWLKLALRRRLQQRGHQTLFWIGTLNGLLPCGLVYAACAGAAAAGGGLAGTRFMVVFGLGTVPMMLGLGLAGRTLPVGLRLKLQRLTRPLCSCSAFS